MDKIVLPIVTANQIMSWGPCPSYTEERVEGLVGDGLDALGILELDILASDRLWAILRPEMIPERILGRLGCDYATLVLPIFERAYPEGPGPRRAIEARRKHLRGEIDDKTLLAARAAASGAAYCARLSLTTPAAACAARSAVHALEVEGPAAAWASAVRAVDAIDIDTGPGSGTSLAWRWIAARTRVVLSHTTRPEARSQSKSDEARASIT